MEHSREYKIESFGRLLDVLGRLRVECPWDKKQTNESLRGDFNIFWNQLVYTYNLFPNRTEKSGPSFED